MMTLRALARPAVSAGTTPSPSTTHDKAIKKMNLLIVMVVLVSEFEGRSPLSTVAIFCQPSIQRNLIWRRHEAEEQHDGASSLGSGQWRARLSRPPFDSPTNVPSRLADEEQCDRARRSPARSQEAAAVALLNCLQAAEAFADESSESPPLHEPGDHADLIGKPPGDQLEDGALPMPSSVMPVTSSKCRGPARAGADTPAIVGRDRRDRPTSAPGPRARLRDGEPPHVVVLDVTSSS